MLRLTFIYLLQIFPVFETNNGSDKIPTIKVANTVMTYDGRYDQLSDIQFIFKSQLP